MSQWDEAQVAEQVYWQDSMGMAALGEFYKQTMYGKFMRMFDDFGDKEGELDMRGKSVVDIGSGPWSMMLRMYNTGQLTAVDPLPWPPSALRRYKNYNIDFKRIKGEDMDKLELPVHDLGIIYNCLQHVEDPEKVIANMMKVAKEIRLFEWLYIPTDAAHIQYLTPQSLLNMFRGCTLKYVAIPQVQECWSNAQALILIMDTGL